MCSPIRQGSGPACRPPALVTVAALVGDGVESTPGAQRDSSLFPPKWYRCLLRVPTSVFEGSAATCGGVSIVNPRPKHPSAASAVIKEFRCVGHGFRVDAIPCPGNVPALVSDLPRATAAGARDGPRDCRGRRPYGSRECRARRPRVSNNRGATAGFSSPQSGNRVGIRQVV